MKLDVDQSGRIERLSHDTIVAASNSEQFSVMIPKVVKRAIFVRRKEFKQIKYKLFCIGVYFCIERFLDRGNLIVIDNEYHGKNNLIKSILVSYIKMKHQGFDSDLIRFDNIGKKSNAHHVAIETFRGEHKPNEILTEKKILSLLK